MITKDYLGVDTNSEEACNASTKVRKEVWIESEVLGLRSAIRKFGMDRYKRNYLAAAQGFEHVLKNKFSIHGGTQNNVTNCNRIQTVANNGTGNIGIDVSKNINLNSYSNIRSSREPV